MQLGKVNGIKSKSKVYGLFKSLMQSGYCERKDIRKDGRHETTIYMFYEDKQQRLIELYKDKPEEEQVPKKQEAEIQVPEKQDPVKQDTTDNISIQERKKKKKRASLPSIEFDYEFNQFANIQDSDKSDWASLYPGVNIDLELGKMRQWLMDPKNPERDGNRTFITNWLSRAAKEVAKTPRKPKVEEAPSNPSGNDIPYNSSIAYSILHRDGEAAYVDYLKAVNEQKYFNNYLDGKYEQNYIDYVSEKGIE
jgi:hypothetical protein